MNDTVKRIVEILFQDTVMTDEVAAIKDEVMNNCQERYADLVARGMTEDEAIAEVVESLKGMEEVIGEFPKVKREPEASAETTGKRDLVFDAGQIELVDVHMISEDVAFDASDDDLIHVQYNADELPYVKAYVQHNTLHVERDEALARSQKRNRFNNMRVDIDGENVRVSRENQGVMETIFGAMSDIADSLKNLSIQISLGDGNVTILLPEGWQRRIQCRTTSGNVEVREVAPESIQADTTSGDVTVDVHEKGLASVRINTTSGDVECTVEACTDCNLHTISGDMTIGGTYETLNVSTTSGDVDADGEFTGISARSVSGDMEFDVQNDDLRYVDAKSTSGDVEINVSDSSVSANVRTQTVSGDVTNRLAYRGEPSVKINVQTVSGDITVE